MYQTCLGDKNSGIKRDDIQANKQNPFEIYQKLIGFDFRAMLAAGRKKVCKGLQQNLNPTQFITREVN